MKKLMYSTIIMAALLVSCQGKSAKTTGQTEVSHTEHDAAHDHSGSHENHDEAHEMHENEVIGDASKTASINDLVNGYLVLKNALAKDDAKIAASTGKEMAIVVSKIDEADFTDEQKVIFSELNADTKEHFEHIGANAGEIAHQREHFAMLSQNISELIEEFGSELTLYKDHCPMYDNGNGAIWISEMEDIKNPYYGKKMLTCGKMQEKL